jgi:hypothetical protein
MVFQCLQLHKLTYNCNKIAKQKFGGFVVVVERKTSNCNQIIIEELIDVAITLYKDQYTNARLET